MNESVCQFGPNNGLCGILTTPAPERTVPDAPIAVVLNAGIVHRIGPFRLHVHLARQLASHGFSTLRMDLSGLGDSQTRPGKLLSAKERAVADVKDALDHLSETTGRNRFVVLGLCSGAYNAHQVALRDHRIVGSVSLDGIVFRTAGFYFRHYFLRFLRPRFWRNAIKKRLKAVGDNKQESSGQSLAESEFFGDDVNRQEVANELCTMLNRGMNMLFLYTDGYDDIASRSQFREMYGLRPDNQQLQVEYYPRSEHTFRIIENRTAACTRIISWFENRFASTSS